jgi:hypothetical protein
MKIYSLILALLFGSLTLLTSCGTLGGFEIITFSTSKHKLEAGIDSLYSRYPQYRMPNDSAWKSNDDWSARGYGFLDSRIFFFSNPPQELYYVSFVGDSTDFADTSKVSISVRAVTNISSGWRLEKDVSSREGDRIEERFRKEIGEKLESLTHSHFRIGRD